MKQLFIFLLIAFITIYGSSPKSKKHVWYYSLGIPALSFLIYSIIVFALKTPYSATHDIINGMLPVGISGFIIFSHLTKKMANENQVKVSPILFFVLVISLFLSIYKYSLDSKIQVISAKKPEKNVSLLAIAMANQEKNADSQPQINRFNFKGLTFLYPEGWRVTKEELNKGLVYHVYCENHENSNTEIISFTWSSVELALDDMLQFIVEGMREDFPNSDVEFGQKSNKTIKGVFARGFSYSGHLKGQPFHGEVAAFRINGNSILMSKQSNVKSRLETGFKTIESSFDLR